MTIQNLIHRVRVFFKMLPEMIRKMTRLERFLSILLAAIILVSTIQLLYRALSSAIEESKGLYAEALAGSPQIQNPLFSDFNDVDRDINSLIFSGLMKYDPSDAQFKPDLAESIERSENNLTYIVKIRENVKWHDGEPFIVDDVLFTYRDLIQDPGLKNPILKSAFDGVLIEKIDERTISFTLPKPNSYFVSYLITGLLPKHLYNETAVKDLEKDFHNRKPVGTGSYLYPDSAGRIPRNPSSLTLEAFLDYYGEKPSLSVIRFSFFDDLETVLDERNTATGIPKIFGLSSEFDDKRFQSHDYTLNQYTALFFNLDRPLIKEKRFRQGLEIAVDKESLAKELGSAETIDTPYRNRMTDVWTNKYFPSGLTKILNEFGYTNKGASGFLMDSKGQTLSLSLVSQKFPDGSPQEILTSKTVDFLKRSFEALGIRIDVARETGENFQTLVAKREYDLLLSGQSLGYTTDAFAFWHSSQTGEFGLNFSQLKSFRVDSVLEDLRLTFNIDRKRRKIAEFEKILGDEAAALFLYTPKYTFALDKTAQGFTFDSYASHADRFANISKVKFKKNED